MSQSSGMINYCEHALDILAYATVLAESGQRFAVIASLQIEGGTARSLGSLAVVSEIGQMTGYLSNGCVDRDIILQSLDALQNDRVTTVRYGKGSKYMDIRLPCGGALEIVIDPKPDIELLREAYASIRARRTATLTFSPQGGLIPKLPDEVGAKQFVYSPKPALLLVGRGAIMLTTARLAAQMDFELYIASPDEEDLAILSELKPTQIRRLSSPTQSLDIDIDAHTAVMLLFHDHEWEQSILMDCAQGAPYFLGAMGSRKTHELRLMELKQAGLAEDKCDKIRGPIGLVPSLRNASLIAVSALAEVVSEMPVSQRQTNA